MNIPLDGRGVEHCAAGFHLRSSSLRHEERAVHADAEGGVEAVRGEGRRQILRWSSVRVGTGKSKAFALAFAPLQVRLAELGERWVEETPEGFLFDVKCHRLLSRHATKPDALQ